MASPCRLYKVSLWWIWICKYALPGPGNLWAWAFDGSWWVYSNFFIHVLPKFKIHFVTIFPTPEMEVLITVSPSINEIDLLVRMHDELFTQLWNTYYKIFWPYSHRWQQEMFHPNAVGVWWFIRHWYGYLFSDISPKHSGQWWFRDIFEVIFEIRYICNIKSWDFLLFARILFSFFCAFCLILLLASFSM